MRIIVVKNSQLLGVLEEKYNTFNFSYDDSIAKNAYLANLKSKINYSDELFTVFENLIPENEVIESLKLENSIKNQIGILLHLDNINGSFEFYLEENFNETLLGESETFTYNDVIDHILQSDYTYPNILKEYSLEDIKENKVHPVELDKIAEENAMGLSGFQYKFAVSLDHNKKKVKVTDEKDDLYFIKPYNKARCVFKKRGDNKNYLPYLSINEHIFMTLARDFGFKIPYNAIVKGEVDYHYIIKRFDNHNGVKIDHIDFLALLGKSSKEKYNINIQELIKMVSEKLSTDQILLLYKFLVFSVIIKHGDLHAKNLSLIFKSNDINETEFQLSPFYDISTTKIYKKNLQQRDIGIKIASNFKDDITRKDLLYAADKLGIPGNEALSIIKEFATKFLTTFSSKYIKPLPNEIKSLPFYNLSGYGSKTLEVVFQEYIESRQRELNENLGFEIYVARAVETNPININW
ncbi:MAG: hypothetical protein CL624_13985 [Arcobacter sp.]|nr:hypothetical protein [Arcobacter sp.]